MRALLTYLLLIVFAACAPSPKGNLLFQNESWRGEITSIAELKSLYKGSTQRINEDLIIEGTVTANDIRGEVEDLIVVEDSSGAIEIWIGGNKGAVNYPLGSRITCNCSGLYIGSNYGSVVLGTASTNPDKVVGLIYEDELAWRITQNGAASTLVPTVINIAQLESWMSSMFVTLHNVRVTSPEQYFCSRDPETGRRHSTTHTLEDRNGDEITLFVSSRCDYASALLPKGEFSLAGVISGEYTITIIDYRVY